VDFAIGIGQLVDVVVNYVLQLVLNASSYEKLNLIIIPPIFFNTVNIEALGSGYALSISTP
jgi:hypothetical protein